MVNPDGSRGRRLDGSRAFARRLAADSIASGDDTGWCLRRRARHRDRLRAGRRCRARRVAGLRHGGLRRVANGCRCRPAALSALHRGVRTADLLSPLHSSAGAFDLVVEVFTLQVLTGAARRTAFARTAQLVAPGGRLLVIAGARDEHDDPGKMPWPLTRAEIESFREHELSEHSIADVLDEEEDRGLVRRWIAWFTRTEASRLPPGARKAVSHGPGSAGRPGTRCASRVAISTARWPSTPVAASTFTPAADSRVA